MHNTMWVGWDDSMLPKTLNLFVEDAPHPSQLLFETIQSNMKSRHNKLFFCVSLPLSTKSFQLIAA